MNAIVTPIIGIPQFELSSGNTEVAPELKADITMVEVTEDVDMPAMLTFNLSLWDSTRQQINDDYFSEFALGTPIELAMGIDEVTPIFTGEVTALAPEFGGLARGDSLKVQAYNRLHRLQFGTQQRTFEKMAASEIASSIADEVGLTGTVDNSTVKHSHVTQRNISNLKFLKELAKPINYEVSVDDKTLYFRESQESQGHTLSLTYRNELIEFTPRQRALPLGEKVEVRGWDVKNKQVIVGSAGAGDETSKMDGAQSGAEISSAAFEGVTLTITNEPVADTDEATQIAKARYNHQQRNFIEADGSCVGLPLLRAGQTIEIVGVGETFSGIYYVTSVTHTIGTEGYQTRFKVRRNAV